jgi:hypothetical protein
MNVASWIFVGVLLAVAILSLAVAAWIVKREASQK